MDCFVNADNNWYFEKWKKFGIKIVKKVGKFIENSDFWQHSAPSRNPVRSSILFAL